MTMRRPSWIVANTAQVRHFGGAATWPLAVAAQQPTVPMIGFLRSSSLAGAEHLVAAFRQGDLGRDQGAQG
jgi:hypothetical protein